MEYYYLRNFSLLLHFLLQYLKIQPAEAFLKEFYEEEVKEEKDNADLYRKKIRDYLYLQADYDMLVNLEEIEEESLKSFVHSSVLQVHTKEICISL
ncbi:MAG: hypothetical protein K0S27_401 [Gammaproteobacteria bacterium]|jgi:hypothetical protein|nr:hypothetical protein [Gammaproteobacteria bacterium]